MVNAAEKAFKEKDIVSAKPLLQEAEWSIKDVKYWERQEQKFSERQEDFTGFFKKSQFELNEQGVLVQKRKSLFEYRSGGSQYYVGETNFSLKKVLRSAFEAPRPEIELPVFQENPNLRSEDIKYTPHGVINPEFQKLNRGRDPTTGWERYKPIKYPGSGMDSDGVQQMLRAEASSYEAPRPPLPMAEVKKSFDLLSVLVPDATKREQLEALTRDFLKNERKEERALEIHRDYQDRINTEKENVEFFPNKFGGKTLTVY